MRKPLLVLLDGNNIVHRAFHAFEKTRPLTVSKTGEVVGAVYGFAVMLLKVINELKPSFYAIAFDKKGPTFRHKIFDRYKAQRPPMPEELVSQLDRVRQLVETFQIPIFELEGYEADDILGTLSEQASKKGIDTIIVSGDKDTMQLVSSKVKVLSPKPKESFSNTELFDEALVKQRFSIEPGQFVDYKALVGDNTDNIPGVTGIGPKTAIKLINQYGSLDNIYSHLEEVIPQKLQALLRDKEEIANTSKILANIVTCLPLNLNLDDCQVGHYDRESVAKLFNEVEFYSLLSKLPEMELAKDPTYNAALVAGKLNRRDYTIVDTDQALTKLITHLSAAKSLAFDLETTSLDAMSAQLVGISLSPAPGEAYYIPVGHIGLMQTEQLPLKKVAERLRGILEDPNLPKVAHNGKYDIMILTEYGVTVNNLSFDTMVAAHLLGEKIVNLKTLSFKKLGVEMEPITNLIGSGSKQIPMSMVEIKQAADYACSDADTTGRLAQLLREELQKQELWWLFSQVEMPLVLVLMDMERNGVTIDTKLLMQMSHHLGGQLNDLEDKIYSYIGHQFNINSPRQLSSILFDELQLPTAKRKKTSYSTDAATLEELRDSHPIIKLILDYRQLTKLKSTYIDALPKLINSKTGRVHTNFNQTRTVTGRLSSSNPNLQNIPVRSDLGKEVRQAFIAPTGSFLMAGDYSQIDLRVLAHLSQDPGLVDAFQQDEDIHAATAAQLFGTKATNINQDMRRIAKTVNFGVIYGMSNYGLEQATELSREEASDFISAYFEKYAGIKQYLESTKKQAKEKGFVQTLLGRRRFIPEINSPNWQVREAAERMAINMPVQGTSADIIKVAMINLHREMKKRQLTSKLILQVHDELIFEVPEPEITEMCQLVPRIMSTAIELSVPIKVDIKNGRNWRELE